MNTTPARNREPRLSFHIMPVAATMLGAAVTILTLFHVLGFAKESLVDEMMAFSVLFFATAMASSYISIRSRNGGTTELIADVFFFIGLLLIVIVSFYLVFVIY